MNDVYDDTENDADKSIEMTDDFPKIHKTHLLWRGGAVKNVISASPHIVYEPLVLR